jgi:hypothetical protein
MLLPDYLEGAVDLHVHSSPDLDPRRFDDIELAREAERVGMSAILLKSHQTSTVERAILVSKIVTGLNVYGGLVLNSPVGGFNLEAVRVALALGARQIWMPTRSALNHRRHFGQSGGLSVLASDGSLLPEVVSILEKIASANCVLGTGHLGPDEVFPLIECARKVGVRRIVVTHPEWPATRYSFAAQRELASSGGVFFERCFVSTTHRCGFVPWSEIEGAIADVGVDTTVLSTDLGQPDTPAPVDGFRLYAERLHASGFSHDDIRCMMRDNPLALLETAR